MRLRTRLFLTWAAIMLVLWAGAFWSIQRAVRLRINLMAQAAFEGTQHGLEGMQNERMARMRQAGRLILKVPELRALIAEKSSELDSKNRESLQERLDYLKNLVQASFVTVLNRDARGIAQSDQSPWANVDLWNEYVAGTPQSIALLRRVFAPSDGPTGDAVSGLWSFGGKLYQVVVVPLVFQQDKDTLPEGALVLGEQISDAAAAEVGLSHNSQITFFCDSSVVASSLPPASRQKLADLHQRSAWPISRAFVFELDQTLYHGSIQPLEDPSSGSTVGHMLIQCDQQDAAVETSILRSLALIMVSGLLLAAVASFLISAAITHPVQQLVAGVQRVARGDLELSLPIKRRDELGDLSASFNDMVNQLRSRRELERQVEEAQSASRAKSQFLANMSHEIRTPLNGVIGMTDLLMGTELTDQQRRFAALVKTSAELLTTQINDILDFSKIEAGKLEIERIDFNLQETVEAIVEILSDKASKKKLELACHFHPDAPRYVRGDPDRLRQILVNLVNNAIKFTPSGSIIVRVAPQTEISGEAVVRFSVTDTGIGIPKDRLDRLFRPFSQVDASTTRKYGGTGLGLAISKQLAELMGGAIGVESEPNGGSTFWFAIKLEKQPDPEPSPQSALDPRGFRVLAVDDSQATRAILQEQLASWGLRAETSGDAGAALGALRHAATAGQPYKLAIIDSDMPGTSGFELARAIKSDQGLGNTILMALLPIESSLSKSQLKDAGFSGHMTKPVRQSQLFDNIMRAVAREHAVVLRGPDVTKEQTTVPSPEPRGGRILIAEDNEVNQIVVVELLTKAGHRCQVVDNGCKAVKAALSGEYDVVLMDCQMPEMDGFEATRVIRQGEATASRGRIPIIALTANAIKGDREQCLAAGMDGYCSKPVDPRTLLSQINGFLKSDAPMAPASTLAVGQGDRFGMPAVIVDTLLERCTNSLATIEIVLRKFEAQARLEVERIEQSLAGGDLTTVTRIAHSLKGAASIMAAEGVFAVAAEIERLGRQQEGDQMQKQLAQLQDEVRRCIEYLPQVRAIAAKRLAATSVS